MLTPRRQEGKSPDAVRALIRRWRLIAFGKRGPAFRYSDFDIRQPGLASEKYVTLREKSRMCGGKSKRGVRQLPDAALIEVASLISLPQEPHPHFVRTVPGARFAHLVRVDPVDSEHVRIGARVLHRRDLNSIAADVHPGRVRTSPAETHHLIPIHNVLFRREMNLTRSRGWGRSHSRRRCGC